MCICISEFCVSSKAFIRFPDYAMFIWQKKMARIIISLTKDSSGTSVKVMWQGLIEKQSSKVLVLKIK